MPWSPDPSEHELLELLRTNPDDGASRMVYGDWLEQRGEHAKARFVRGEPVSKAFPAQDHEWRAIASCELVANCNGALCPKRWSAFAVVEGESHVRHCGPCGGTVRYCTDWSEACLASSRDEAVVLDVRGRDPGDFRFSSGLRSRRP
jgi:uncharacterized protein (TIGR02996 family)